MQPFQDDQMYLVDCFVYTNQLTTDDCVVLFQAQAGGATACLNKCISSDTFFVASISL